MTIMVVLPVDVVNVSVGQLSGYSGTKNTQIFKCQLLPLENDFGHRCESGKVLNLLCNPRNGATVVSSF